MEKMKVTIFGGTDLTLEIAEILNSTEGVEISGMVYVGEVVSISYSESGISNSKFAPVREWCSSRNIPNHNYVNTESLLDFLSDNPSQVSIVAGWYHMIPKRVREIFKIGCFGLHASLLPKFRGGAPLNWAMLAKKKQTGISLFELSDGVDDGLLLGQKEVPIFEDSYISDLLIVIEKAACQLIREVIEKLKVGEVSKYMQEGTPSYCGQRFPQDSYINWNLNSDEIALLVRSVSKPYPGAYTFFKGEKIIIWRASELKSGIKVYGNPGQILFLPDEDITVSTCGAGSLIIEEASDAHGNCVLDLIRKSGNQRFEKYE